jgi:XTP/dITP diphosphohydrolase
MKDLGPSSRSARFVCVAALVLPAPRRIEIIETGTCEGIIAPEARGQGGFGYDPVFFLPDVGKTMAELTPTEKNARSHRGRALALMRPHLLRFLA